MRNLQVATLLTLFLVTPTTLANDLILSAPPREPLEKARQLFQPIADHLTRTLGRPVVFRYSRNWLTYQSDMQKDLYDIVFDGPHFVSYRMTRHQHIPMVKLPGNLVFAIIAKKDSNHINKIEDVNGRLLCAPAPPNLAALTAQAQFTNPSRQPIMVNTKGLPQAYEGLISNKCVAASIPNKLIQKFDKDKNAVKVIFESQGVPNQAITVSPRLDAAQRAKFTEALLSDAGKLATANLREAYNAKEFVPATTKEYENHYLLLKDVWGFQI